MFLAYAQYDLDGDGQVSRTEYDTHADLTWGTDLGEREYAILEEEWQRADRDGDGVLQLGEIHALALAMHPVPDAGPLGPEGEAMLLMDLDNDGFVTWGEVEAVLAARRWQALKALPKAVRPPCPPRLPRADVTLCRAGTVAQTRSTQEPGQGGDTMKHLGVRSLVVALGFCAALPAAGQMMGGTHMPGGHMPGGPMHGADGTGHDEVTMPGLRGLDATPEESAELAFMFRNFPGLNREVEPARRRHPHLYLVGRSGSGRGAPEPCRRDAPKRVDEGRDPQVFIQSPTLDILFERRATITTEIETSENGIWVTQTSTDRGCRRAPAARGRSERHGRARDAGGARDDDAAGGTGGPVGRTGLGRRPGGDRRRGAGIPPRANLSFSTNVNYIKYLIPCASSHTLAQTAQSPPLQAAAVRSPSPWRARTATALT
ncbi:MAG: hypothetical protein R3D59_05880 [Paracoccaceae bacterium]